MSTRGVHHRIDVIDTSGKRVATRDDFLSFRASLPVNGKGAFELDLMTNDGLLIENCWLVLLWRRNFDDPNETAPQLIYTGINRTEIDKCVDSVGKVTSGINSTLSAVLRDLSSNGYGLNDIYDLAYIAYHSEHPRAKVNGDLWDMMRNYTWWNLDDPALVAQDRYVDNDMSPVVTAVTAGPLSGINYEQDNAEEPLMSTLQQMASLSLDNGLPVRFWVDYSGGYQFDLRIEPPRDLTMTSSYNNQTTLNAAGNKPVVLGIEYGNVNEITRIDDHSREYNQIIAVGKSIDEDRRIAVSVDPAVAVPNDPLCRRELIVNGDDEDTDEELQTEADEFRARMRTRPQFAVKLDPANLILWSQFRDHDLLSLFWKNEFFARVWVTDIRISIDRSGNSPIEEYVIELTLIEDV